MSRRRLEAVTAPAPAFSLRTAFSATATPTGARPVPGPLPARRASVPPSAPPLVMRTPVAATSAAPRSGLSFSLSGLPAAAPAAPPAPTPTLSNNPFARQPPTAPTNDAMRYTAVIDELTGRLRKESEKKAALEHQITRMQQTLASVKSEANAKLKALQADLGTVQASEVRMRKELAAKPAVAETTGAFEQQVKATLEAEAAAGRVAEAEERLAAAEARHKELKVEVDMLQAHRAAAISAMAPKDGSLSEQGVEALLKKVSQATKRLETLENRREALKDDVDRFGALAEARRADAAAARRDATLAQAETAEAASDAAAARTQTKDIDAQLVDARADLERVSAEVAAAQTDKEVALSARRGAVSGAEPPRRALHAFEDTPLARVAAVSRVAVGTPAPLAFDCPVDIGVTGPADQAGQAMVDAVLADLQVFFNNSIAESAQRAQPMAA